MTNLQRIQQLRAMVERLIARLENEKRENQRLTAQLASKDGELAQLRKRWNELNQAGHRSEK